MILGIVNCAAILHEAYITVYYQLQTMRLQLYYLNALALRML
jgi:hypothetical protein